VAILARPPSSFVRAAPSDSVRAIGHVPGCRCTACAGWRTAEGAWDGIVLRGVRLPWLPCPCRVGRSDEAPPAPISRPWRFGGGELLTPTITTTVGTIVHGCARFAHSTDGSLGCGWSGLDNPKTAPAGAHAFVPAWRISR